MQVIKCYRNFHRTRYYFQLEEMVEVESCLCHPGIISPSFSQNFPFSFRSHTSSLSVPAVQVKLTLLTGRGSKYDPAQLIRVPHSPAMPVTMPVSSEMGTRFSGGRESPTKDSFVWICQQMGFLNLLGLVSQQNIFLSFESHFCHLD